MSIFQDVHTYLVISFVATAIILWKLVSAKITMVLDNEVDGVRSKISSLEVRKKEAEGKLKQLRSDVEEEKVRVEKSITTAENEARKIIEASTAKIAAAVESKQNEYSASFKKLHVGLAAEIQNRIISLVIGRLSDRLKDARNNRELQNQYIDLSLKMLEDLADDTVGPER
ncbi:MAG: hypothetical protein LBJ69_01730 [Holosporales bacterium]|jgi:F0F1-type ATP synthase membrane subunit b/b'|nr:hypothetical protein [Holosporales bacterium]